MPVTCQCRRSELPRGRVLPGSQQSTPGLRSMTSPLPGGREPKGGWETQVTPQSHLAHSRLGCFGSAPRALVTLFGETHRRGQLFSKVSKSIRHTGGREASLCPSTSEGPWQRLSQGQLGRVTRDSRPQSLLSSLREQAPSLGPEG